MASFSTGWLAHKQILFFAPTEILVTFWDSVPTLTCPLANMQMNAYAHWFEPFVSNAWSMLDAVCSAPSPPHSGQYLHFPARLFKTAGHEQMGSGFNREHV